MKRAVLAVVVLAGLVLVPHSGASAAGKQHCAAKLVTKKIHGKKKQVAVKVCSAVQAKAKPLADVRGTGTNLNDILELGIVLGADHFCCFDQTQRTFIGPTHFQVKWTVWCAQKGDGAHSLADFSVVGYDGNYQAENLYTGYDAGSKSGTTNIDTTGSKRWAFVVSDADKQHCAWHLTAYTVSI